jgi:hypothetical protein
MADTLAKRGRAIVFLLSATSMFSFGAQAQVDLTKLDRDMVGAKAKVLVLGTIHLNRLGPQFNPASLDSVLGRLAAFSPDIITIETESGEECDLAARHPAKYGPDYCASTEEAKAATGLDIPAARRSGYSAQELA